MIGGCPVNTDLVWCLYHYHPELLALGLLVIGGLCLVWKRWTTP